MQAGPPDSGRCTPATAGILDFTPAAQDLGEIVNGTGDLGANLTQLEQINVTHRNTVGKIVRLIPLRHNAVER